MPPTGDNENRQGVTLLLVAGPHHLAGPDVRALLSFLDEQKHTFNISFSIADPQKQPELLELHRLVATPALIKLDPAPKQIFAGNAIQRQLQNWLPRWQQLGMVSGLSSSLNPSDTAGGTSQREMQLEDQLLVLRQENETLTSRLGVQERLLRMVAHELRTPFNSGELGASELPARADQNRSFF